LQQKKLPYARFDEAPHLIDLWRLAADLYLLDEWFIVMEEFENYVYK